MTRGVAAPAALVAVLVLAACTTSVSGQGRRLAGGAGAGGPGSGTASASASGSGSGTGSAGADAGTVPSGAPVPVSTRYPDTSPEIRSYLYARDITYSATHLRVTGTVGIAGLTATVTAVFGFDTASDELVGTCRLTVAGATAEVRGIGDDTWASAPAAFWTAYGTDAGTAAAAAGRWVAVAAKTGLVAACNNDVAFLSQFEPQTADTLRTGVDPSGGSGPRYFIEDGTTGVTTYIDQGAGTIVGIRTAPGTLTLAYPDAGPTVTAPAPVVTVPGI